MTAIETEYDAAWADLFQKRIALVGRRASLEAELSDVTNQISHLNEILSHLGPLAGLAAGENIAGMGITDAIRWLLKEFKERMSPTDVRDKLVEKGFDLSSLTAPMASIYKVLSRLADDKEPEVIREKEDDGRVFYRWKQDEGITDDDIPF